MKKLFLGAAAAVMLAVTGCKGSEGEGTRTGDGNGVNSEGSLDRGKDGSMDASAQDTVQ
jgi:hypothetical protein